MSVWKGVFPAVTTKLAQDGKVDLAATQSSIDRLINNGVSGIIVLPMLGENASLLPNERESVIRAAIEVAADRVPVLSGLAEITIETAKTHARAYEGFGAQGLMVFPSLAYNRPARNRCLVQGRRKCLGTADYDLQQSDRIRRRFDACDTQGTGRDAANRLRKGRVRRYPPCH